MQPTREGRNLRNVRSPERTYPSQVRASDRVFESGRARLDTRAEFLVEPTPPYVADLRVDAVPLERLGSGRTPRVRTSSWRWPSRARAWRP